MRWKGWAKQSPKYHERLRMMDKCGKKCFLGENMTFPVCVKNTCRRNPKGIHAAYVRARQYSYKKGYSKIAKKAKRMLEKY